MESFKYSVKIESSYFAAGTKCTELDYINFLVAFSRVFNCTETLSAIFLDIKAAF
jgi:hypothetical protein